METSLQPNIIVCKCCCLTPTPRWLMCSLSAFCCLLSNTSNSFILLSLGKAIHSTIYRYLSVYDSGIVKLKSVVLQIHELWIASKRLMGVKNWHKERTNSDSIVLDEQHETLLIKQIKRDRWVLHFYDEKLFGKDSFGSYFLWDSFKKNLCDLFLWRKFVRHF